jgi:hypothetical protein
MFGWNVRRVAEDIIAERVSKKELTGILACWLVVICPIFLFVAPRDTWGGAPVSIVQWLASIIIFYVGLELCYDANEKGDAQHFIERFIILGARVGMIVACFLAIPILITRSVVEIQWGYSFGTYSTPAMQIIFFWRLHHWMDFVSQRKLTGGVIFSETTKVSEQSNELT